MAQYVRMDSHQKKRIYGLCGGVGHGSCDCSKQLNPLKHLYRNGMNFSLPQGLFELVPAHLAAGLVVEAPM